MRGVGIGAVRFGICGMFVDGFAFGRAEPNHAAMKLRHEWGTRVLGWDVSYFPTLRFALRRMGHPDCGGFISFGF
jgi:hypothetical protein